MRWIRQLFSRRRIHGELSEEIRVHLEEKVEELVAGGVARKDAEAAARREFGNVTLAVQDGREVWRWMWLEDFWGDVRYAFRMLRKNAGFSAIAILILALGIGVNTAVFSLLHAVLLRPLPYRDPGKLAMLWVTDTRHVGWAVSDGSTSYRDFLEWKRAARSFEDVALFYKRGWSVLTLSAGDEPEKVQGGFVGANFFALMGIEPQMGRAFSEEDVQRRERLVILSYELWQTRFGGSPDMLGRDIQINGTGWRVIGVMPERFRFPFLDVKLWAPLTTNPFEEPDPNDPFNLNRPQSVARFQVIGRLKRGIAVQDAQAEMDTIAARQAGEYPDADKTLGVRVRPLDEYVSGEMRKPLWLLSLCVLVVLLIACTNLATLFLARSVGRRRELAVRAALGASRWRVVRQLLTESALLGLIAGGAGVLLAKSAMGFLVALAPFSVPRMEEAHIDPAVLGFSLVLSLACGISFGLAPARRFSGSDPQEALKSGRQAGGHSLKTEGVLVGAQFALSLVLLASASLLIRSFVDVLEINPGFKPEHILTMQLEFADPDAMPTARISAYYQSALERVREIPGVQAAGTVGNIFFLEEDRNHALKQVEGRAPEPESSWTPLVWTQVSGDYFSGDGDSAAEGAIFQRARWAGCSSGGDHQSDGSQAVLAGRRSDWEEAERI
jgi:predicted permease